MLTPPPEGINITFFNPSLDKTITQILSTNKIKKVDLFIPKVSLLTLTLKLPACLNIYKKINKKCMKIFATSFLKSIFHIIYFKYIPMKNNSQLVSEVCHL